MNQNLFSQLSAAGMESDSPLKHELTAEGIENFYTFAYHFYESGKYNEAADFFRVLTAIGPHETKYWMGMAASLQMQKEYEKALEAYSVAALLEPGNPLTHLHAADCCFALEQIDRGLLAVDAAERAIQKDLDAGRETYKSLTIQIDLIREAWKNKNKKVKNS